MDYVFNGATYSAKDKSCNYVLRLMLTLKEKHECTVHRVFNKEHAGQY
jgi:hypothetical protein